jgi:hypothetical protein
MNSNGLAHSWVCLLPKWDTYALTGSHLTGIRVGGFLIGLWGAASFVEWLTVAFARQIYRVVGQGMEQVLLCSFLVSTRLLCILPTNAFPLFLL